MHPLHIILECESSPGRRPNERQVVSPRRISLAASVGSAEGSCSLEALVDLGEILARLLYLPSLSLDLEARAGA